ncbi:yippee zinc-binding/DNA-binding /Mis18, centromere assembly-domain-containing protein [Colletotrichum acutatum]|uniref:Yippee zinc-binding/DNA-binding /Mis18, centromere assembly-domain-containing protein n=1 Tax=Glomerella acutata TaxID=27357 RepID=A0AAD8UKS3_GLOAC|nr:yippee zinc-binding/DNA-binding /Mis18, centromere assembly-domain-containing protein [Colletotrichum acutatum]KAK1724657.1 yippee zinc-binding/DNA-binding /Mis18, centromere assembly-domain-containing protein [Colletotrichum acutatum]
MAPNIVVSRPTFPTYLLPSFNIIPFRRRRAPRRTSSASEAAAEIETASTSPDSTPDASQNNRNNKATSLARTQPDTLRCSTCSCDIAFASQIVSKGFTGRYGRAYLIAPTGSLANVRIGKCENRQLVTGWHVVADITCVLCSAKLGWKYVDAKELSQKYKVGKFILEVERVVPFRSWEDDGADRNGDDSGGDDSAAQTARKGASDSDVEVVFDSEDEDDLEDMFSGNWDPEVVAKRRSRRVATARKK